MLELCGNRTKFNRFPPNSDTFLVIYFFFSVIFINFAAVFRGCPSRVINNIGIMLIGREKEKET